MGKGEDLRSDLFAVGIILFELISGRYPFEDPNDLVVLKKIQACEIDLEIEALDTEDEVKAILRRALAKDVEARYQSAAAFQLDIQQFFTREFSGLAAKKLSKFMDVLFSEDIASERKKPARLEKTTGPVSLTSGEIPLQKTSIPPLPKARKRRTSSLSVVIGALALLAVGIAYWMVINTKPSSLTTPAVTPQGLPKKVIEEAPLAPHQCRAMIDSSPRGAEIFIDGVSIGVTPSSIDVDCAKVIEITLERSGYTPIKKRLKIVDKQSRLMLALIPILKR